MKGLIKQLKNSNNSLKRAISKTKNKKLKKELQKRLDDNERMMGYEYYT